MIMDVTKPGKCGVFGKRMSQTSLTHEFKLEGIDLDSAPSSVEIGKFLKTIITNHIITLIQQITSNSTFICGVE